jgi:hypothetical protein
MIAPMKLYLQTSYKHVCKLYTDIDFMVRPIEEEHIFIIFRICFGVSDLTSANSTYKFLSYFPVTKKQHSVMIILTTMF